MLKRVLWFLIALECIVTFCVFMGNFPAMTVQLYPLYEAKSNGDELTTFELDEGYLASFGVWTSRKEYTLDATKAQNDFDHRVNTIRVFHTFAIIVVLVSLLLLVNEMCMNRWDLYEKTPADAAHAYYRAQYLFIILQFYLLLIATWIYTTLIQLDWVAWPLSLLIVGVALSALAFAVLTGQMTYPPKQDSGNGRVTGLPLVFLLISMIVAALNLLLSFGCLATYPQPRPIYGDPDVAHTTLSILAQSYIDPAYKHAVYAFFACEFIVNLEVLVVISVMLLMRTEDVIYKFTYVVLASVFTLLYFSLASTWLLSRAPALFDPVIAGTRYASGFIIEVMKFVFNNILLAFVITAFVVDPQDGVKEKHRLHKHKKHKKGKHGDIEEVSKGSKPSEVIEGTAEQKEEEFPFEEPYEG